MSSPQEAKTIAIKRALPYRQFHEGERPLVPYAEAHKQTHQSVEVDHSSSIPKIRATPLVLAKVNAALPDTMDANSGMRRRKKTAKSEKIYKTTTLAVKRRLQSPPTQPPTLFCGQCFKTYWSNTRKISI
jgi:hypothetical protein